MRIALGQINTTVGDLTGNVDRMIRAAREAAAAGAEMVVFPELSVTGYPPSDLVFEYLAAQRALARALPDIAQKLEGWPAPASVSNRHTRRDLTAIVSIAFHGIWHAW